MTNEDIKRRCTCGFEATEFASGMASIDNKIEERIQKKMENSECKLTKEDCDKLEELRISLWDNTFEIEKNVNNVVNNVDKMTDMIL